jgi:hypothetical protein
MEVSLVLYEFPDSQPEINPCAFLYPATTSNAQPGQTQSKSNTPRTSAGGTATATGTAASITSSVPAQITITDSLGDTTVINVNSSSMSIDGRDPAGGISMISPNPITTQYFKVGDWVHFKWNYTSLQATPSAVNVAASCSQNNYIYTLASNMSVQPTGEVFWDTGAYQNSAQIPLLTNKYTLYVWDAAKPLTASASPGYLGSNIGFQFSMYTPQPYVNLSSKYRLFM